MHVERNEEPTNAITRIADAALTAAERCADEEGVEVERILVLMSATGVPAGEDDSTVASGGIEHEGEMLEMLLSHARAVATAMGIDMQLMPVVGPEDRKYG